MDPGAGIGVGAFVILWVAIMALSIVGLVFWVITLIEVVRIPDHQFRAGNADKTVWILVVALAGWIGALVWRFTVRNQVLAAEGYVPMPPPGWYPEPGTGAMRWWDGQNWWGPPHVPPSSS